jgi:uncharacterized RDD family membrane protein YckC
MHQNNPSPSSSQRLSSMFLDHCILTITIGLLGMICALPLSLITIDKSYFLIKILGLILFGFVVFILVSLYVNKDIIQGRNPAKRVFKHQIVDKDTNKTASPLQCLLRNITLVIWPIEVIVVLFNPSQRLGDKLANTKVVIFDESKEDEKIDKKEIVKVLVGGFFLFTGLMMLVAVFQYLIK